MAAPASSVTAGSWLGLWPDPGGHKQVYGTKAQAKSEIFDDTEGFDQISPMSSRGSAKLNHEDV